MAFDDRYRCIDEQRVLETFLLCGWAFEVDQEESLRQSKAALDAAVTLGLVARFTPDGRRLFDPVEVLHVIKQASLTGQLRVWHEHFVTTGRKLVNSLAARPARNRFIVKYSRSFNTSIYESGTKLRLRMPLPLADYHRSAVISVFGPHEAKLGIQDGRLEASIITRDEEELTLQADLEFALPDRVSDCHREVYLKPREGLISVSTNIADLAVRLAGSSPDIVAVRAFWSFILEHLSCVPIHYDQICLQDPCDWILGLGGYDCQLGAALLIALCRARDIPARLVGGYFLYKLAPTNHYWAEIFLNDGGWTPFDLLSWDLSGGGEDAAWRDHFFGYLEPRMITQRMPFAFTGAIGVSVPDQWLMLQLPSAGGVAIEFRNLNAASIYTDTIRLCE